jgi:hypothetical protein
MKASIAYKEKWQVDDNIVEIKIWEVPVSQDKPHGYKYSLVYIKGNKRIVGYDNAESKGDHRHYGEREEPYIFKGIDKLFKDFYKDLRRYWQ